MTEPTEDQGYQIPPLSELKCEICKKPAVGVCSASIGAISHAYCQECIEAGREPWSTLVGASYGLTRESVAEWFIPTIEATCAFYKKTVDEFWAEVKKLEDEYDAYMKAEYEARLANGEIDVDGNPITPQ